MTEEEEFEFRRRRERERATTPDFSSVKSGASTAETGAVTGRGQSPRSAPNIPITSATEILQDVGAGAAQTAANIGTHVVDAATEIPRQWSRAVGTVFPKVGEAVGNVVQSARDRGRQTREFWEQETDTRGPGKYVGGIATDIAGTGGIARPVVSAVRQALPRATGLMRATTAGGVTGGASGALSSTDAGEGGAIGTVVGAAVPAFLRKAILGTGKSRAAQALLDEDVPLTVGQAAERQGMGTVTGMAERGGKYFPLAGSTIENRQQDAVRAWRDAAMRRTNIPETPAGPAVAAGVTRTGRDTVEDVLEAQRGAFDQRYNQAVEGQQFIPDEDLERGLLRIISDPDRLLDERGAQAVQDAYRRILQNRVRSRPAPTPQMGPSPVSREYPPTSTGTQVLAPDARPVPQGRGGPVVVPAGTPPLGFDDPIPRPGNAYWTGRDLMQARRVLNRYGHRLVNNPDPYRAAVGSSLRDLSDEVLSLMGRQNEPVGRTIQMLRAPYSALRTLEDTAAGAAGQGTFTPAQLRRHATRSSNTELENLARNAEEVFHSSRTGPRETGVDLRSLAQGGIGALQLFDPSTAAMNVGAAALYRPGAQRLMLGQTRAQRALADYFRRHPELADIVGE